jgi:DNA-binding phage protein
MKRSTARALQDAAEALREAREARDDAIIEAFRKGGGMREIADEVGMSYRGVAKLLERAGVRKPWTVLKDIEDELAFRERMEREHPDD